MHHGPSLAELLKRLETDLVAVQSANPPLARDEEAWNEIRVRVRSLARIIVLSRYRHLGIVDVEDIEQEVLLKLQSLRLVRRLRGLQSAEGYLIAMIRNTTQDHARRQRANQTALSRLALELVEEELTEPPDRTEARVSALRVALRSLTPQERTLLRMRFWKNLSIGEIAPELGLGYSAAAVRMFRLLRRLRAELAQSLEEPG